MPTFSINFRRESYLKEVARARRRVMILGMWVGYFGMIVVVLGLYDLNCLALYRRVAQLERHAARVSAVHGPRPEWKVPPAELVTIERYVRNPREWHDRLERLAVLLPASARLTSLAVNPDNLSGPGDQKLVIEGEMKLAPGPDRMRGVMDLVAALRADSAFTAGYRNVRLASTRINEGLTAMAEFVVECQ